MKDSPLNDPDFLQLLLCAAILKAGDTPLRVTDPQFRVLSSGEYGLQLLRDGDDLLLGVVPVDQAPSDARH